MDMVRVWYNTTLKTIVVYNMCKIEKSMRSSFEWFMGDFCKDITEEFMTFVDNMGIDLHNITTDDEAILMLNFNASKIGIAIDSQMIPTH